MTYKEFGQYPFKIMSPISLTCQCLIAPYQRSLRRQKKKNPNILIFSEPKAPIFVYDGMLLIAYVQTKLIDPQFFVYFFLTFYLSISRYKFPTQCHVKTKLHCPSHRSSQGQQHNGIPVDLAGLPEYLINNLPTFKVGKSSKYLLPGRQCRLCLQQYKQGQFLRPLPDCGHVFHRSCIDKWLTEDHR